MLSWCPEYIDYLANKWADMYEEFLGGGFTTNSEVILQDVYWSSGLFGYFPSYALGVYIKTNLQLMNKEFSIEENLSNGNF